MTRLSGHGPRSGTMPDATRRDERRRRQAPSMMADYAPHVGAGNGGGATMKASSTNQLIAAAPAATIATAAPAERPRAGERTVRLGDLLPEAARADAGLYAFLYFVRESEGRASAYYAAPDALVHADARLMRGGGSRQAVLALPKVCGGGGRDDGEDGGNDAAAPAPAAAPLPAFASAPGGAYPETVPMPEDGDGFEDSGLILDRIVGVEDEYEDSTSDERARAAEAHARLIGGAVYTQVDDDNGGIAYERGLHLVNRTGVYAVARLRACRIDGGQRNTDNAALASIVGEASVYVKRAEPGKAARLVARATKFVAEAEHDSRNGGACDDTPGMLAGAANSLVLAAAEYRELADRAEAAAGTVRRAEAAARSALRGGCPVAGALRAGTGGYEAYVDEWYDLGEDDRDQLYQTRENSEWYTLEFRDALEGLEQRRQEHGAACAHPECATTATAAAAAAAASNQSGTANGGRS